MKSLTTAFLVSLLCAPVVVHAQDGGADAGEPLDAAVGTDGGNQPPSVMISVIGGITPCMAPCRELHSNRAVPLTLNATVVDPEGDAVTVLWELRNRPQGSLADVGTPTSMMSTLTPDLEGTYDIGFVAQDSAGNTQHAELTVVVEVVAFVPDLVVKVDGSTVQCQPECSREAVRIGSTVEADATGTTHDQNHGGLTFAWHLEAPPGSTVHLKEVEDGKVSFRPDVDGPYQLTGTVADDQDSREVLVSFVIPNVLHYKPLSGVDDFKCSATTVVEDAGIPVGVLAGLVMLARWRRRR